MGNGVHSGNQSPIFLLLAQNSNQTTRYHFHLQIKRKQDFTLNMTMIDCITFESRENDSEYVSGCSLPRDIVSVEISDIIMM